MGLAFFSIAFGREYELLNLELVNSIDKLSVEDCTIYTLTGHDSSIKEKICDRHVILNASTKELCEMNGLDHTPKNAAIAAKCSIPRICEENIFIYLDSDTILLKSIDCIFRLIESGWEMAICPSLNQGARWLKHVTQEERDYTLSLFGYKELQLQSGMFACKRCINTDVLMSCWLSEVGRFQEYDQGALMRALVGCTIKYYTLSNSFNGITRDCHVLHRFCDKNCR